MDTQRHKYKIGEEVYDKRGDEFATIEQLRIENTHLCYRLDTGAVRHEKQVVAVRDMHKPQ